MANVTTEVEVANLAIRRCGGTLISALDDGSRNADLVDLFFSDTRDEVMRSFSWNCLLTREDALVAAVVTSEFAYAYTLPADCLRVISLNGDQNHIYRIESGVILCDVADPVLLYIRQEATVTDWDPILLEAIVARVASKIAYPMTADMQLAGLMMQEFVLALTMAGQIAAVEEKEDVSTYVSTYQQFPALLLARNTAQE